MMSLLMTRSQQQAPRLEEPASTIAKSRAEEKLRWWPCSRQRRLWERTSQIMYRTILNLSTCISTDINKNTLLQWHIDKFVKVEKREANYELRIYESSLFPFGTSFVKSEIHAPFFLEKSYFGLCCLKTQTNTSERLLKYPNFRIICPLCTKLAKTWCMNLRVTWFSQIMLPARYVMQNSSLINVYTNHFSILRTTRPHQPLKVTAMEAVYEFGFVFSFWSQS